MVLERTVKDIMTQTVITVKEDMILTDVIKLLLRWHISGIPVVDDDNNLLGIITEHDVVNFALSGNAADTKAREVMTKQVETCAPDTLFVQIVNDFASRRIRRIPVVENGRVVGIISRRDIIREMDRIYSQF
jgi:CBS domain-containing protein